LAQTPDANPRGSKIGPNCVKEKQASSLQQDADALVAAGAPPCRSAVPGRQLHSAHHQRRRRIRTKDPNARRRSLPCLRSPTHVRDLRAPFRLSTFRSLALHGSQPDDDRPSLRPSRPRRTRTRNPPPQTATRTSTLPTSKLWTSDGRSKYPSSISLSPARALDRRRRPTPPSDGRFFVTRTLVGVDAGVDVHAAIRAIRQGSRARLPRWSILFLVSAGRAAARASRGYRPRARA
jgi:hypothetical protein